jgi:hypothetical protein
MISDASNSRVNVDIIFKVFCASFLLISEKLQLIQIKHLKHFNIQHITISL